MRYRRRYAGEQPLAERSNPTSSRRYSQTVAKSHLMQLAALVVLAENRADMAE
jgi:hypothetical protein